MKALTALIGLAVFTLPLPRRVQCHLVGHSPSWVLAATMGLPTPVCDRCGVLLATGEHAVQQLY